MKKQNATSQIGMIKYRISFRLRVITAELMSEEIAKIRAAVARFSETLEIRRYGDQHRRCLSDIVREAGSGLRLFHLEDRFMAFPVGGLSNKSRLKQKF